MRHSSWHASLVFVFTVLASLASAQVWNEVDRSYDGVIFKGQCVPAAREWAAQVLHVTIPRIGARADAKYLWLDRNLQPPGTVRMTFPSVPQPDDILITNDGKSGHIAVVSQVDPNQIWIVDSNWNLDEKGRRHAIPRYKNKILGWFRKIGTPRPLMRYLNYWSGDHFYSIYSEVTSDMPFRREVDMGRVFDGPAPGTTRIYSYYNPSRNVHFMTLNFSELGYRAHGYHLEARRMYAYPADSRVPGTTLLYRYRSIFAGHFFTIFRWELGNGTWDWVYEGERMRVLN